MRLMRLSCTYWILITFWAVPHLLFGQTGSARLAGRVTDPQGRVVPGAVVEAINNDTNVRTTTKSNEDGLYYLSALQPGEYRLIISKVGFKQIIEAGLALHTQDELSLNFRLQLGSVSETLTISGSYGNVPITDSPAVGILVDRNFVGNMPLNGRSLEDLIALAPGAVSANDRSGTFSINGQRTDANYFTVDGVAANTGMNEAQQGTAGVAPTQTALGTSQSLVPIDALDEFKIQTSTYSAEYGRQPGGQVEFRTRSGTNNWHGTVFDYFRNTVLDANGWFTKAAGIPQPPEHQNDFGGTFGGPLILPGIYDGKDKTFFFFSFEGLRLELPGFLQINVPTVAFRAAVPTTVQPFLNATPIPNGPNNEDPGCSPLPSCTAIFRAGIADPANINSFNLRLDHTFSKRLQMFARSAYTTSEVTTEQGGGNTNHRLVTSTTTLGGVLNLRSNLVNEFRSNYTRDLNESASAADTFGGAIPFPKSLVIPEQYAPSDGSSEVNVGVNLTGMDFIPIPTLDSFSDEQSSFNVVDGLSLAVGTHQLKFGGDFRNLRPPHVPVEYGAFWGFTSIADVQNSVLSQALIEVQARSRPSFDNLSLYFADHWKMQSNLTLDYGLRWEFNPPMGYPPHLFPLAVTQIANLSTLQIGPAGTPLYHTRYSNFAPRFGLAYQVPGLASHPLIVRGGGGLFYDTGQSESEQSLQSWPFFALAQLNSIPLPASPSTFAPPPLAPPVAPYQFTVQVVDPHLKLPYTWQWSIGLDFNLAKKNVLSASYVGNEGRRLLLTQYFQGGELNPQFQGGIDLLSAEGWSTYHSLQVRDQGYITNGLEVLASYTWSHAVDITSSDAANVPPQVGNSDNDVRQVFNVALNYQIPGSSRNRWTKAFSRGWLLAYRFSAQTGYPFDVDQGAYDFEGSFIPFSPQLVPGVPIYLHDVDGVPGKWRLNPAAFSPVPTDPTTGAPLAPGVGRNYFHGPNFWNLNTALERTFSIREPLKLLFRAEAFNIFNHPNFGGISNFLGSANFGEAEALQTIGTANAIGSTNPLYSTGSPRSLQLSLKFQF
jgi:hypothetical protein